ncbi:E3 ubiquitin-protein ligase UPL3 [Selaginella moellendorffii]|uniref:E3 ubiquitin-protein ligase UPL3 n=1 Tax=Selaginella moellendorffii TaxID=88036 RepID=UPI000D1CE2BF|nr:E3 ubiquitin-protein ligase UPL3 [Selaginella moellendorffii]|eukprot:XP_024534679.1 E3 ubiquitin-protein ligase UPL3 [Selaginella moellendorffii]
METRSRKRAEATGRRPPPAQSSSRASKRVRVGASSSSSGAAAAAAAAPPAPAPVAAAAAGASSSRSRPSTRRNTASQAGTSVSNSVAAAAQGSGSMDLTPPESGGSRRDRRDKDKASKREHDKDDDRGSEKVLRGSGEKDDKGKEKEACRNRDARDRAAGASVEADDDDGGDGVSTLQQNLASASSALHGLLRKLGAGLDEFLPSSTPAHQSSRLKRILSGLKAEGEEGRQLEALSQLCELLSIGTEESLSSFSVDSFVPVLVSLLNHEYNPDVMLLAARALTHLCDVLPSSCAAVVHYGAVPCFCARLLSIEYIDLAEQSLQALEKISHEHPAACLRAGALVAVLSYLDFFSTGVQRVAVSTAANICRQLPSDGVNFVMESVPILTNLLQYQDPKVVDHASLCLTRIADSFANSSEKIDVLCSHGLIPLAARLVSVSNPNGAMVPQTSLSASTYTGLIRLLSSCASGSASASESLLLLNISSILKDILTGAGLTSTTSVAPSISRLPEQLFEIVNLVNELLPPVPDVGAAPLPNGVDSTSSSKVTQASPRIQLLQDRPELLLGFGADLFPVLVQVYGSSVTSSVRHKCLAAIHKLLYFSTPEMLHSLSKDTNISSFLAGVLASKDPSVLLTALHITELLMQKLPGVFAKTFVKEGVVHAIDTLIACEQQLGKTSDSQKTRRATSGRRRSGSTSDVHPDDPGGSSSAPVGSPPNADSPLHTARLGLLSTAVAKAKFLRGAHFCNGITDGGATESLCRLKSLCSKLTADSTPEVKGKGKGKAKACGSTTSLSEEQLLAAISGVFGELENGEGVSTFEFVNSGIVSALLNYLSCGSVDGRSRQQALNRLKNFLAVALSSDIREAPLTVLVRKLQNALGSLERFPVILSHGPRATGSTASIAAGLSALTQPFKLRLCRASGEKVLRDYSTNVVLIEPLATLAAIEDFLWSRVKRHDSSPSSTVAASSDCVSSPPASTTPTASTSTPSRPSTRSRTAAAGSGDATPSKGKGKAKTFEARATTESRGPETRNAAARRRAAAAAASAAVTKQRAPIDSEDDDADASPVEVEDAVAMDEDDVSEDEEELFGEEPAEVCVGDRVHDVQLGDSADAGAVATSATTSETPSPFGTGAAGSSTPVLIGTGASGSRATAAVGKGALSFAAAAMAGANASKNSKDRKSLAAIASANVPPKLSFYLGGKLLNRSLTIFQAIQRQTAMDEDDDERYAAPDHPLGHGRRLWDEVYTITYQRADPTEKTSPGGVSSTKSGVAGSSSQGLDGLQQASLLDAILQGELPCDLDKSSSTYNILLLLRVLEGLNRLAPRLRAQGVIDAFAEGKVSSLSLSEASTGGASVLQEEFLSSKLTPKLARQMQDALALCSGGLPAWCHQLTKACPFLFPFETRRQYFHSTAFGLSRALQRLQQQQSADGTSSANERELRVGRLQRQKVRVSRTRILDSAAKVMELYSGHKAVLEVEYFGEVGTGLGPTLEFYTLVSRELQKNSLDLWRTESRPGSPQQADTEMPDINEDVLDEPSENQASVQPVEQNIDYVTAPHGLFPRPWHPASTDARYTKTVEHFRLLGRVMAKALQDGRLLDLPFSIPFYKLVLGQELDLYDVKAIDPELGSTLDELQGLVRRKQYLEGVCHQMSDGLRFRGSRIEDLCLDFTLPGYPEFHLKEGGNEIMVTLDNLEEYVALVVDATVKMGISAQMEALRSGFSQVFQLSSLQIFTEQELDNLLCGRRELWTPETLVDHIKFDHGYTSASPPVRHLLEIMGEFTAEEQRDFLRFATGAPRLPPGGLAALNPKLTIVRKHPTGGNGSSVVLGSTPPGAASAMGTTLADGDLPSVMTCANYLKLPPYSSREVMRERLMYAISEGQGSFDLS